MTQQSMPGPSAFPLLGGKANMLKLYSDPYTFLRSMHETYGDIVALTRGDHSNVFVFSPELNLQVLAHPSLFQVDEGTFVKWPKETALGRLMLNNIITMNGEHHKQQRHLMQPAFHKQQIGQYRDDMVRLTLDMLEQWRAPSRMDLYAEMKQLTLRIVVKTLFGVNEETDIERIGYLMQRVLNSLSLLMVTPLIDIPGMPYHRILKWAAELEGMIRAMIAQKRSAGGGTDVLATLLRVHDEDGQRLSDDELVSHTFSLYSAGHETVSNALAWTFFLLDQHPEALAALLNELDGTLHGEAPTLEQLRELPLLDAVIKESLRMLPPVSMKMRIAAEPCELGGYALPKGAIVYYSPFVTHRRPELYEEPDRFQPQRWLTLKRSTYEYLPFAAGPHRCIGADFAMLELKVVLALLLQRYRLAIVSDAKIDIDIRMAPSRGIPVELLSRNHPLRRVPVRGNIQRLITF